MAAGGKSSGTGSKIRSKEGSKGREKSSIRPATGSARSGGSTPGDVTGGAAGEGADSRLARGMVRLSEITGRSGEEVMAALGEVAPDFARYIFEFGYGDVYSRPGLDLRTRMLATVAGLVALGHAERELTVHIGSALNVGATREEVVEVIMQMALYAGFPAALDALLIAKKVFAARDAAPPAAPPPSAPSAP